MNFTDWKAEVDTHLADMLFGQTSDDLPDYLWHDAYMDGFTPLEAAHNFVEDLELA